MFTKWVILITLFQLSVPRSNIWGTRFVCVCTALIRALLEPAVCGADSTLGLGMLVGPLTSWVLCWVLGETKAWQPAGT